MGAGRQGAAEVWSSPCRSGPTDSRNVPNAACGANLDRFRRWHLEPADVRHADRQATPPIGPQWTDGSPARLVDLPDPRKCARSGLTIRRDQDVTPPPAYPQASQEKWPRPAVQPSRNPPITRHCGHAIVGASRASACLDHSGPLWVPRDSVIASTLTLTTVEPRLLLRYGALTRRLRFTSERGLVHLPFRSEGSMVVVVPP